MKKKTILLTFLLFFSFSVYASNYISANSRSYT